MIIMMIFSMSTSYFHKFSFCYFEDYLMRKLGLRVRYLIFFPVILDRYLRGFRGKTNLNNFLPVFYIRLFPRRGALWKKYVPPPESLFQEHPAPGVLPYTHLFISQTISYPKRRWCLSSTNLLPSSCPN
jgi:hypothetical protein